MFPTCAPMPPPRLGLVDPAALHQQALVNGFDLVACLEVFVAEAIKPSAMFRSARAAVDAVLAANPTLESHRAALPAYAPA